MTKTELIAAVKANDVKGDFASAAAASRGVNIVLDTIAGALKEGNDVAIPGFGSFTVVTRPAHDAKKPATGETVHVPERKSVKFKISSTVVKALN